MSDIGTGKREIMRLFNRLLLRQDCHLHPCQQYPIHARCHRGQVSRIKNRRGTPNGDVSGLWHTQATVMAVTSGSSVQAAAESDVNTLRPVAAAVAAMMRSCAPRGLPTRFT